MKLMPSEISAVVVQEIRRVRAPSAQMTEADELLLKRRAEWKIEHAMRTLDAGELLPTALNIFHKYWEQLQLGASAQVCSANRLA